MRYPSWADVLSPGKNLAFVCILVNEKILYTVTKINEIRCLYAKLTRVSRSYKMRETSGKFRNKYSLYIIFLLISTSYAHKRRSFSVNF